LSPDAVQLSGMETNPAPRVGQVRQAAAIEPPERRARRSEQVFRAIAALILASAAIGATASATQPKPSSNDTLLSNSPWWEKITVTIAGNGKAQSCLYESSLKPASTSCDVDASPATASDAHSSPAAKDEFTRITFERRFTPGAAPAKAGLQAGDTLLGGQMLALAINPHGAVEGCKIVAKSGDVQPEYGCAEATAERFDASATRGPERDGYMTILVYGHSEHMV
jgi:hypothetical protein